MAQNIEHSNLIKGKLKEKGRTQTWLAKQLVMSFSMTNAYVCNRKQPNLATIFKVADLLEVPPKELVE
jgi:DNA-binding protein